MKAQVQWWKKKYSRFPPERSGYTYALRVARLVVREGGFHLEQAGEGGQPGAISYGLDMEYREWPGPKTGILREGSSVPLWEVALVKRLPGGEGISITSHIDDLGVKFGDILFLMPCQCAKVALSFTERPFYVSSKFTEERLYTRDGLNFIDITGPMENLIKRLYQMYEQEERDKLALDQNKEDHEVRAEMMQQGEGKEKEELMGQREEQERQKQENLQRRAESKKYKCLRKEMKGMAGKMKLGTRIDEGLQNEFGEEDCSCTRLFSSQESTSEEALREPLAELSLCNTSTVGSDLVNLGGGWKNTVTA